MLMAITALLPTPRGNAVFPSPKQGAGLRVAIVCFVSRFHQTTASDQKLHSSCTFYHVCQPLFVNNFK